MGARAVRRDSGADAAAAGEVPRRTMRRGH